MRVQTSCVRERGNVQHSTDSNSTNVHRNLYYPIPTWDRLSRNLMVFDMTFEGHRVRENAFAPVERTVQPSVPWKISSE